MPITIDLPFPPSVNAVWRSTAQFGRVLKSEEYRSWLKLAGGYWMQQRGKQEIKHIDGSYKLEITLTPPDKRRRDLGNYEKALSDFCQEVGIVNNDCLCEKLSLEWDRSKDAIPGARLILVPC